MAASAASAIPDRSPARGRPNPAARAPNLADAIESEILPRLLLARPPATRPPVAASASDIAVLADLALRDDESALAFVTARHGDGMTLEAIYLDLLAPTARQLGEQWENDTADFTQVTIGVWRLQRMLRALAPAVPSHARRREDRRRVLLAPVPGEQHVFAVAMLAEMFERAGWEVAAPLDATAEELAELAGTGQYPIVGLSLSGQEHLETMPALIRALRRSAGKARSGLGVLVGGPLFRNQPDWVAMVGADATAADARQAIVQAETLLGLLAARPA